VRPSFGPRSTAVGVVVCPWRARRVLIASLDPRDCTTFTPDTHTHTHAIGAATFKTRRVGQFEPVLLRDPTCCASGPAAAAPN
jgi:hypothetical protein